MALEAGGWGFVTQALLQHLVICPLKERQCQGDVILFGPLGHPLVSIPPP